MKIVRKSIISGVVREREMPEVTEDKLKEWRPGDGKPGKRIQDVFPTMAAADREFILTGVTPDEIETHLVKEAKKKR